MNNKSSFVQGYSGHVPQSTQVFGFSTSKPEWNTEKLKSQTEYRSNSTVSAGSTRRSSSAAAIQLDSSSYRTSLSLPSTKQEVPQTRDLVWSDYDVRKKINDTLVRHSYTTSNRRIVPEANLSMISPPIKSQPVRYVIHWRKGRWPHAINHWLHFVWGLLFFRSVNRDITSNHAERIAMASNWRMSTFIQT